MTGACTLYDVGRQDNIDYLVMEYLEGETLAARLEKGALPPADVLRYGIEIADALDRAHRGEIVHRDLKPGNIMLTKAGAKLMDFGLARSAGLTAASGTPTESPTVSRPLTAEGTIVGTFQYMAPEQLEGKEADARSDLWALGCVLYEMATGKRAFEGTSPASLIAAILKEEPRPMLELRPTLVAGLQRIVKRCLEKDRDERFQSAKDLAFALEGLGADVTAAPATGPGSARTVGRLPSKAIVVTAFAVLFFSAATFLATRLLENPPKPPVFTRLTFQRGRIGNARFMPGGNSMVYSAAWDGGLPEVFQTETDPSSTRPLGLPGIHLHAVNRVGALALEKGAGLAGYGWGDGPLAVVPVAGNAPRDLLEDVAGADWSADGTTLAIVRPHGGEYRIEMPPGHILVKTSGWFRDLRILPDGGLIAFTEHPVLNDNRGSVAFVDATGRKQTLTGEFGSLQGLAWSPDGREIWFSAETDGVRQNLCAVTLKGKLRIIARFPSSVVLQDVGSDGRVLFVSERVQTGIRVIDVNYIDRLTTITLTGQSY